MTMKTAQTINGLLFAQMLRAGCENLRAQAQSINNLNVFPIPDGDTGDNMLSTVVGGVEAAGSAEACLADTARRISDGMLLSARGNSGVILSQIFEGIADGLTGVDAADSQALLRALQEGVRHSYRAVLEPTEGTMLTVFRLATEAVSAQSFGTPKEGLCALLKEAERVLRQTPEMLPVLKKAGVVDSGGAGLLAIGEGMLRALEGDAVPMTAQPTKAHPTEVAQSIDVNLFTEDSVLEYGYCTELLLRLQRSKTKIESFEVSVLTEELKDIGNSMVAFQTGSIVKIHIHTMTPDRVLAVCQRYGEFLKIKIENMSLQHNNVLQERSATVPCNASAQPQGERKPFGVVAVANGDGIKQLFAERGADEIVDGGQSRNPSAEEFLEAFRRVNADTIFVFPNNGNIILTARQAAGMERGSDVRVIESRTVGDGYAALSMLSFASGDADVIERELTAAMDGVLTAEVSKSVRDTDEAHAGEYIGFVGHQILASDSSRAEAVCATVEQLAERNFEICILLRGREVAFSEAEQIRERLLSRYPEREFYVIDGMQEIYDYIMILE